MSKAFNTLVFDKDEDLLATVKKYEDAAALCEANGKGTTIRWGKLRVLWTEGLDGNAADSYEYVATIAKQRKLDMNIPPE